MIGHDIIRFAIKNLLNEERCFGGGQPCGLAAASAWGRRPPKAGGGPTKYHQLAFRNSLHQVGINQLASGHQKVYDSPNKDIITIPLLPASFLYQSIFEGLRQVVGGWGLFRLFLVRACAQAMAVDHHHIP
jgi:hypothetical protein